MRIISTRDLCGAVREFIGGDPENWDGGDYDFSDLAEGVDGISPEERDGSAPRLPFVGEAIPTESNTVYAPPVRKRLEKGRRVGT